MIPTFADAFPRCARFVFQSRPGIQGPEVIEKIGMGQGGPFGHPRGTAGVNDQRQVLRRVDVYLRRRGLRTAHHVVEHQMARSVLWGLGNLAQQPA